jgi:hypothetical protein
MYTPRYRESLKPALKHTFDLHDFPGDTFSLHTIRLSGDSPQTNGCVSLAVGDTMLWRLDFADCMRQQQALRVVGDYVYNRVPIYCLANMNCLLVIHLEDPAGVTIEFDIGFEDLECRRKTQDAEYDFVIYNKNPNGEMKRVVYPVEFGCITDFKGESTLSE